MKIEEDKKLDFSQVLIRPKRSTLNSRSEVELEREFKFKWSSLKWKGVPIIASNMDSVGTFEVYNVLSKHNIITALHKFYTVEDFKQFANNSPDPNLFAISTGIGADSLQS